MTETVERVARAIWNIRRQEEDRCDLELEDIGKGHSVWVEARHAIKSIREPTEDMGEAAYDAVSLDDRWHIEDMDRWNKSFNAAIDAALA